MNQKQADNTIAFIRKVSLFVSERVVYRLSPDPKDNYLFDLAIQHNCAFVISDDSELIQFQMKPVPVYTTNWLLKNFPINQ